MTLADLKRQVDELVTKGVHPTTPVRISGWVLPEDDHGYGSMVRGDAERIEVVHQGGVEVNVVCGKSANR